MSTVIIRTMADNKTIAACIGDLQTEINKCYADLRGLRPDEEEQRLLLNKRINAFKFELICLRQIGK